MYCRYSTLQVPSLLSPSRDSASYVWKWILVSLQVSSQTRIRAGSDDSGIEDHRGTGERHSDRDKFNFGQRFLQEKGSEKNDQNGARLVQQSRDASARIFEAGQPRHQRQI